MRFQPGNQLGRRWQPGESGNPAGRRPKDPLKSALLAHLDDDPDLPARLVAAGIEKALAGDFRYWKELWDRLDGKVMPAEPEELPVIDWSELDNECDTVRPSGRYVIDYASQPEIEPESTV
jgi:hypothetical protein